MTKLRAAVAEGYLDFAHVQVDTDFDALRSRPDFQLLMMDMMDRAMPSDPFAARP